MQSLNNGHFVLPDPEAARQERDRAIAQEFVDRGETRAARKEISDARGIPLSTVYRAIRRELAWAKGLGGGSESRPTVSQEAVTRKDDTRRSAA